MRGNLRVSIVSAFGLITFAWGNTVVIAMPIAVVAQATVAVRINRPVLKSGAQDVAVSELQAVLKLLGYYTGAVDGVYGQSTVTAVSQFQQAAGLNPDGVVNAATWERLFPPASPPATSAAAFPVPATTTLSPATANNSASNNTEVTNQIPAATTPPPATTNNSPTNSTRVTNSKPPTATKPTTASGSRVPTKSPPVNLPVLRLGEEGAPVKRLQQRLQALGLFKGSIDGIFGSETENAVKAAQRRYRLKPDGVVGSATWKILER